MCGAGGTGKTTTRNFLAEALDLPTMESASRLVYTEKGINEEDCNNYSEQEKLDLQTDIFNLKAKQDNQFSYVADRTLLDHYCYCLTYCGNFMDDETFNRFEDMTRSHMRSTYNYVFYFPWGYFEAEGDGVRRDLQSWQSMIDAIMVGYIMRWDLPVVEVPQTEGIDARNQWILRHIIGDKR
jgi:hypothetical protein